MGEGYNGPVDVLAVYKCGTRCPTSDPEQDCPECGASLDETVPLEGLPDGIAKASLCTTNKYKLKVDLTAVLDLGEYTEDKVEETAQERVKLIEHRLAYEFSAIMTDVETSLEIKED